MSRPSSFRRGGGEQAFIKYKKRKTKTKKYNKSNLSKTKTKNTLHIEENESVLVKTLNSSLVGYFGLVNMNYDGARANIGNFEKNTYRFNILESTIHAHVWLIFPIK